MKPEVTGALDSAGAKGSPVDATGPVSPAAEVASSFPHASAVAMTTVIPRVTVAALDLNHHYLCPLVLYTEYS